jgi:hypothetical protein
MPFGAVQDTKASCYAKNWLRWALPRVVYRRRLAGTLGSLEGHGDHAFILYRVIEAKAVDVDRGQPVYPSPGRRRVRKWTCTSSPQSEVSWERSFARVPQRVVRRKHPVIAMPVPPRLWDQI